MIDGGGGNGDAVSYSSSKQAQVNLSDNKPETGGDAQGDVLKNIEDILAYLDDVLTGDDSNNWFWGLGGRIQSTAGAGQRTAFITVLWMRRWTRRADCYRLRISFTIRERRPLEFALGAVQDITGVVNLSLQVCNIPAT